MTIVLITGAGSLGSEITKQLLSRSNEYDINVVRVIDNNEYFLDALRNECSDELDKLRILLGDITDYDRMCFALKNVDIVIHTAAKKNLAITEYNLEDTIKTNVIGTLVLCKSMINNCVNKLVYINTDKSVNPINVYGMTKQLGEKIVLWFNDVHESVMFSSIRFGNFNPSHGCVFEVWNKQMKNNKPLTVTSDKMHRYIIDLYKAAEFTIDVAFKYIDRKCVFIPKMEEYSIYELAKTQSDNVVITGIRKNEKLREELYNEYERPHLLDCGDYYIIKY